MNKIRKAFLQYKYILELIKQAICNLKTSKGIPELQFTDGL